MDLTRRQFDGHHPLHTAIIHQQLGDEEFVIAGDGGVFQGGLEQRVQHMEAGFIGGEPGAHFFHATEGTHGDMSVRFATPGTSPMLEPQHLFWRFPDEGLDCILIAEPVAARDGVAGMLVQAIIGLDDCGGTPFGRDRVAAHRVDLRDHR